MAGDGAQKAMLEHRIAVAHRALAALRTHLAAMDRLEEADDLMLIESWLIVLQEAELRRRPGTHRLRPVLDSARLNVSQMRLR